MAALGVTSQAGVEQQPGLPPSMVERMTLILDAFESRSARLSLEDVAGRTRLPRSTAHRILDQLVRLGWLDRVPAGYCPGPRVRALGDDGGHAEIRSAAAPLLHELHLKTGMVVHLAVLDGGEVYYLDKVGGRFARTVPSRVGGRAPAHRTALGKAMLAWLAPEQVDDRVGACHTGSPAQDVSDLGALHRELHGIRTRHGLSFEHGECYPGISCVAAAIRGAHTPLASVSLVGDRRASLEKVAPLALDAARQASRELSAPPSEKPPVAWVPDLPEQGAETPETA